MGQTLTEIAQQLKDSDKKVQLIYAFNGTGKTRLSREFKELISPMSEESPDNGSTRSKILYYNAFTEDLFYWDNDLEYNEAPKLKIQPNAFTDWIFFEQGQDQNVISNFQRYTDEKLTPHFNNDPEAKVKAFSEVSFSFERGNESIEEDIKISKGEESNFIWSVFYTLMEQVVSVLNVVEEEDRETKQFDKLEYIFIDDPVSSLDENHLIELAVDLAQLIKSSESQLKFVITTHNPLFYNILHNELKSAKKYFLKRYEDGTYILKDQRNDSPFSYHLYLKTEIENAISTGQIQKYHFNFFRNILEKTSTFLGYKTWGDLLTPIEGDRNSYIKRIINNSSHSNHSSDEVAELTENDKRVLRYLIEKFNEKYQFNSIS